MMSHVKSYFGSLSTEVIWFIVTELKVFRLYYFLSFFNYLHTMII